MKIFYLKIAILLSFSWCINANTTDSIDIDEPNEINSNNIYKAVALTGVYYAGSMYILSQTWYKDRKLVPFHFYDDTKGFLQVDKFGHTFGAYVYSCIGYEWLSHAGFSRTESLIFGGGLGLLLQTPIEIMDGIHEGYGFSWGDMLANSIGSGLVIGQELLFKEQIVKYKFSYWNSIYADNANGFLGESKTERILKDYNGHTYWLTMPINKIIPNNTLPNWLSIALGYSANGMYGEFENITNYNGKDIPYTARYRQFLFSLDIDLTKIETNSRLLRTILYALNFFKFPFPAIEYNTLGEWRLHLLYF